METSPFYGASNLAGGVDTAFAFIFGISIVFTLAIVGMIFYILYKFSRKRNKHPQQFSKNINLEITWTVIPLIIVLAMFYYGWIAFAPMRNVPKGAMEITAIGKMWAWEFDYGNGKRSKELYVPLERDVKLNLVSLDVDHSLFIPAFRVKENAVPGYNNYLWFRPLHKGTYDLYCALYCGLAHSGMITKTVVVDSLEFNKWLAALPAATNMEEHPGYKLLKDNGCLTCHSLDGSRVVGPSFKGLYGTKRVVVTDQGEKEIEAFDDYIKRSIVEPNAEIVKGYPKGLMQSYKDVLKGDDLDKIVDYFRKNAEKK